MTIQPKQFIARPCRLAALLYATWGFFRSRVAAITLAIAFLAALAPLASCADKAATDTPWGTDPGVTARTSIAAGSATTPQNLSPPVENAPRPASDTSVPPPHRPSEDWVGAPEDAGPAPAPGPGGVDGANATDPRDDGDNEPSPWPDAEVELSPPDAGLQDTGVATPQPPTPLGEPLPGTLSEWTYVEFPDATCRDGSPAGIFVNLGRANKLMIFLEGGGRCINEQTCNWWLFPANVEGGTIIRAAASAGVFDRNHPDNPVGDWDIVYVPYCTGDRHAGANPDGYVEGVGPQRFVGYLNLQAFLARIVPTFANTTDVLLTGMSAGGFGVSSTLGLVQRSFPDVKVKAINDSGPFLTTAVFTACDQERSRILYNSDQTFLADCGAACPDPTDYWMDYGAYLAEAFADRPTGLIITMEDAVERALFGYGLNDCTYAPDTVEILLNPPVNAAAFSTDLLAYRERISAFPNASTFYVEGETHSFLGFDEFYTTTASGLRMVDWFAQIVRGESPGHIGP